MHLDAALSHFKTRAAIAEALDQRPGVSAVYQWRDAVPLAAARRLEEVSGGEIRVDESMYDLLGRAVHPNGLRDPKKKSKPKKKKRHKRA